MLDYLQIMPQLSPMKRQYYNYTITPTVTILPLLLAGGLLLTYPTPGIAQSVLDGLPPAPPAIPFGTSPSLQQQPTAVPEIDIKAPVRPPLREQNYTPPRSSYRPSYIPYSKSSYNYSVYVNSSSPYLLRRVQRIEPTAYIKRYSGYSVIQAGAFKQEYHAQRRVNQLQSLGIRDVRLAKADYQGGAISGRTRSKTFFIAIPGNRRELPRIVSRVREVTGRTSIDVRERDEPRGTHVLVGPFYHRQEAETWNRYLQRKGLGNARVYYGS
jgi:hypothetical protein